MATLAQPAAAPAESSGDIQKNSLAALMIGAIGVVYGDIGTSPLYAMKESFVGAHPLAVDRLHIFGVLSLIFWSLMLIVTLKYVLVAMRADNKGEGGSFALLALISRTLGDKKWTAGLVTLGVLATALAVVGLYGVMAYTVARRTREIGIRMALGARGADVGWLVMRETLAIAIIGAGAGLPIAWWLSRFVESQLYGVTPMDGTSIVGAIVALSAAALVAGLAPTRRAVKVEPIRALRID